MLDIRSEINAGSWEIFIEKWVDSRPKEYDDMLSSIESIEVHESAKWAGEAMLRCTQWIGKLHLDVIDSVLGVALCDDCVCPVVESSSRQYVVSDGVWYRVDGTNLIEYRERE